MRPVVAPRVAASVAGALAALLMAACAPAEERVAEPTRRPVAPPTAGARQGTGPDDIVYDPAQMADFACHGMDFTIMGRCTPEEREAVEAEIRARAARGERVGVVELPGGEADEDGPADAGDIVFDPNAMAAFPCHAMGTTIMGDCTPEEVEALRAELLARRASGAPTPTPFPVFAPGDDLDGIASAPPAGASLTLPLEDGARIDLDARPVTWSVGGAAVSGYGYNGTIPGPLIRVRQGASIQVDFENRIDQPTTIHWHGLRHDYRMDGVPGVSQEPIPPGGSFRYALRFPDAGIYWYHPHVREDIQQDAGLYGFILVEPAEDDYAPADVEEVLVLDDVFLEDGRRVPYGRDHASFAIMGRFGSDMVTNGRDDYRLVVAQGDVVRFYVGNVANVRTFRLSFDGAPTKRVAGDMSRYLAEAWVDDVVIAPAERYVVDVAFDEPRTYRLLHEAAGREVVLGTVDVRPDRRLATAAREAFDALRVTGSVAADVRPYARYAELPPDVELELTVDIPNMVSLDRPEAAASAIDAEGDGAGDGSHADDAADDHAADGAHAEGIEWEDDMLAVNRASTSEDVSWMIRDVASGAVNHDIHLAFAVGDRVRVRLSNLGDSQHPMQHPIHFHGQRLLVLSRDGVPETNPVWKDTILMPVGQTAELLLEVTNPGTWMVHCHIAEHLETGMMFAFTVSE